MEFILVAHVVQQWLLVDILGVNSMKTNDENQLSLAHNISNVSKFLYELSYPPHNNVPNPLLLHKASSYLSIGKNEFRL